MIPEMDFAQRVGRASRAVDDLDQGREGESELGRALDWLRIHAREAFRVGDVAKLAECTTLLERVEGEIRSRVAQERLDYRSWEPL